MRKITREEEFTLRSLSRAPLIRTQNPNPSEETKMVWAMEDASREATLKWYKECLARKYGEDTAAADDIFPEIKFKSEIIIK